MPEVPHNPQQIDTLSNSFKFILGSLQRVRSRISSVHVSVFNNFFYHLFSFILFIFIHCEVRFIMQKSEAEPSEPSGEHRNEN